MAEKYIEFVNKGIQSLSEDTKLKKSTLKWMLDANINGGNFSWLGRQIIQYPRDMIALKEIIWEVKPDMIIETGIAHGGSLIFSASMLTLLEACGENKNEK